MRCPYFAISIKIYLAHPLRIANYGTIAKTTLPHANLNNNFSSILLRRKRLEKRLNFILMAAVAGFFAEGLCKKWCVCRVALQFIRRAIIIIARDWSGESTRRGIKCMVEVLVIKVRARLALTMGSIQCT